MTPIGLYPRAMFAFSASRASPLARRSLLAASTLGAVFLSSCRPPRPAEEQVPLASGWILEDSIPATVPGTVHTDLLAAGLIPDPFAGTAEPDLQWIERRDWRYRLDFSVPPRLAEHERVDLVFDGLDTYAAVELNGDSVLSTDNMFRTYRVEVGPRLRPGANALTVTFASPVRRGREAAASQPWPIPHQEPDSLGTRAFTRKSAYHYGWDWGPRYVPSGIWRPVRLEGWSGTRIRDVHLSGFTVRGDTAHLTLRVEVESTRAGTVRLGVRSPDGAIRPWMQDARVAAGVDTLSVSVAISHPRLWWPRGYGEPYRYTLRVDLVRGRRSAHRTLKVGLRTVTLDTLPDSAGAKFRFVVNDVPVFARGANVVPLDHFTPRADTAAYRRFFRDLAEANMNMVRVWGGGIYERDLFYDLADSLGIMVWQDFMFANALVPADSAFAANVVAEARDQIRRLRNHPSIVLWCGNNEIAEAWENWGWQDDYTPAERQQVKAAYDRIFHGILPRAVSTHDTRPYWPSSPSLGWGDPESLRRGDSHYWGVWWGMEPFAVYREKVPRFASEFGFQALPDPLTLAAFRDGPGTSRLPTALSDPPMSAHQKHPSGYQTLRAYLARDYPVPQENSLDAWSYMTQLLQAEGVATALRAHRRSWPYTGGTLFWQFNDTWPVVSWSSRDYFGRRKALFHSARRIFRPVTILAEAWSQGSGTPKRVSAGNGAGAAETRARDSVAVWAVADTGRVEGEVVLHVVDLAGKKRRTPRARDEKDPTAGPRTLHIPVTLEEGVPQRVWAKSVSELGVPPRSLAVEARLIVAGHTLARDFAFGASPRNLELPTSTLRVVDLAPVPSGSEAAEGHRWRVSLTSDAFAYAVRMGVKGTGARWSDNFFHILPGDTVSLRVETEQPVADLRPLLTWRWLDSLVPPL
ncbi:MAG: glycoside hydrolase family 2 protein [Gemmatimonadota bacterium]